MKATRDKEITRRIHRLFWEANFRRPGVLALTYLTRIPAWLMFNIFIPLVSAYGIQAIINREFDKVGTYAWWIMGLSGLYVLFWSVGNRAVSQNAVAGSIYVQNKLFGNFLNKDYEFFSNAFFGSLGAQAIRIRDAYNMYGELVTLSIPRHLTIIFASAVVIAWFSPLLAIITLVTMVTVLGFTLLSSNWRLQFRRRVSEAGSVVAAHVGDAMSHGATVKSFAMEQAELDRLQKPLRKWADEQYKSWIASIWPDAGRMVLAALATAGLLVISAKLYEQGAISITIVVLIQLYVIRMISNTVELAEVVKRYEEVMGAAYEPVKTMLVPTHVKDPAKPEKLPANATHQLRLEHVTFHYPDATSGHNAVDDLDLTIQPGQKIGVVGYSGSGKTTLTKLLLRFMDVTDGAIKLGGIDIRHLTQSDLRSAISYVPQEPLLFHRSIADNIAYAKPGAALYEIEHAAKLAYVDEFVHHLPQGYDTLVGERGVKLSGGQRQRVAIARALLKNSPVLVLDEATSALDSQSEKYIQEALWELMKDRTAIVIAHRLSTIQRLDHIIVMDKGRIVQSGPHTRLVGQSGIYADLWAHQSGGYIGVPTSEES